MTKRRRFARSLALAAAWVVVAACRTPAAPEPQTAGPQGAAGHEEHGAPAAEGPPSDAPIASPAAAAPAGEVRIHLEGTWIAVRAERLGLDPALAAQRDAAFARLPPEDGLWWDEQLATEVWGLWSDLCVECHGGSRTLKKVLAMPPPARRWTETDALFFTRSRAPHSVFRVIAEGAKSGKPDVKDMPAWQSRLSNEQMWGLVHFIRSASKKKGGDLH